MSPGQMPSRIPSFEYVLAAGGARAISKLKRRGWSRRGIASARSDRAGGIRVSANVDTALGVRSILELRMGLETQAAALAAQRRSEQQVLQMRQALDDYQRLLANNDSCVEADRRFHLLIAEATGNVCFSEIMQHLGNAMIPRARVNAVERGAADLSKLGQLANLEHEAILNAIKRQDPDAARAAMWLHLTNSRDRFLAPGLSAVVCSMARRSRGRSKLHGRFRTSL